jgi:adenine phosphoribosyltransferase
MIKEYIRTVPDYPVAGVNFYDMNSLFASLAWNDCVRHFANTLSTNYKHITHIVGIESRGFVVGAAVAHAMNLPFVMLRKKGAKYPGKLLEESYALEYGTDSLVLQEGVIGHTSRVVIADDLIATGGSAIAASNLCRQTGATVIGLLAPINLVYLNKPELERYEITTLLEIRS